MRDAESPKVVGGALPFFLPSSMVAEQLLAQTPRQWDIACINPLLLPHKSLLLFWRLWPISGKLIPLAHGGDFELPGANPLFDEFSYHVQLDHEFYIMIFAAYSQHDSPLDNPNPTSNEAIINIIRALFCVQNQCSRRLNSCSNNCLFFFRRKVCVYSSAPPGELNFFCGYSGCIWGYICVFHAPSITSQWQDGRIGLDLCRWIAQEEHNDIPVARSLFVHQREWLYLMLEHIWKSQNSAIACINGTKLLMQRPIVLQFIIKAHTNIIILIVLIPVQLAHHLSKRQRRLRHILLWKVVWPWPW